MKFKFTCLVASVFLSTMLPAQTMFWQDDFENSSAPDVPAGSTRLPSFEGGTTTSYFKRSNNTVGDLTLAALFGTTYGGMSGSFIWAGEDHDTPTGNGTQSISWNDIAISGRNSISFRGNFAANNTNGAWDNVNTSSLMGTFGASANTNTTGNDYILLEYAIDLGPYTPLLSFFGDNVAAGVSPTANKSLNQDTNGDFIGDGLEPGNINLTQFVRSIPGNGNTLNLRLTVYSNGSNEEWAVDNFRLFATVLPVTWTQFEVTAQDAAVDVSWGTASEANSAHFAIERSGDGVNFAGIGQVAAAGQSSTHQAYAFRDAAPLIGRSYYRVRQVDTDGQFTLSEAREVNHADALAFEVFPQPAQDQMILRFGTRVQAISIVDLAGSTVAAPQELRENMASLDVRNLANGMYFARLTHAGGVATRRFVVQR